MSIGKPGTGVKKYAGLSPDFPEDGFPRIANALCVVNDDGKPTSESESSLSER
jgi:hypothetical protein